MLDLAPAQLQRIHHSKSYWISYVVWRINEISDRGNSPVDSEDAIFHFITYEDAIFNFITRAYREDCFVPEVQFAFGQFILGWYAPGKSLEVRFAEHGIGVIDVYMEYSAPSGNVAAVFLKDAEGNLIVDKFHEAMTDFSE